jgi:uncharacterized RDD family membrane protein YckC
MGVETPEHVQLTYELAGLGSRFLAALMDVILQAVAFLLIILALAELASLFPYLAASNRTVAIAVVTGSTFIFLGYHILFEMLWNGQTPGKRAAGIRVLREDGTPITLTESLLRNLLRPVDFLPVLYGIGMLSVFVNARNKRLGDIAAGTVVIKERVADELPQAPPTGPAQSEQIAVLLPLLASLTEREEAAVEQFMERRDELAPDVRARLAARLALALDAKLEQRPVGLAREPEAMIEQVYQAMLLRRHQL